MTVPICTSRPIHHWARPRGVRGPMFFLCMAPGIAMSKWHSGASASKPMPVGMTAIPTAAARERRLRFVRPRPRPSPGRPAQARQPNSTRKGPPGASFQSLCCATLRHLQTLNEDDNHPETGGFTSFTLGFATPGPPNPGSSIPGHASPVDPTKLF